VGGILRTVRLLKSYEEKVHIHKLAEKN